MSTHDTINELNQDSLDKESLLASLSLDLMTDSIKQQIDGYVESPTDFLGIVLQKFNVILEDETISQEDKSEVKFQMIDFCQTIITEIANKYNMLINLLEDGYEAHTELAETLYNFFVLNRYENAEQFLIQYIKNNIDTLSDALDIHDNGKDVTTMAHKQMNLPKPNIIILSHVTDIIGYIRRDACIENEEMLNTLDVGEYYVNELLNYCTDGTISGNFVQPLLNDALGDDYDNMEFVRIRNNIRIAFSNVDDE